MWARLAAILGLAAVPLAAQTPPPAAAPEVARVRVPAAPGSIVTAAPGPQYRAGWFHRLFFGDHYRDLWSTPIRLEVLDLSKYGGGLKPTRRSGGKQTKGLRLEGADGRKYAFRSVDKDPSPLLPEDLRRTLVSRIFQDQISASHPAGALVVPPLLDAVGVRTAEPGLFVMPDDPALGEFRAEFAGLLGTLEERPADEKDDRPGFAGARKVADTEELFERLDRSPNERVDAPAFLAARLMDLFLGDWDRHIGQWQWIQVAEGKHAPWLPVPYDRDQAFVRYDGFLLDLARMGAYPQLVDFGRKYPGMLGLHWNARFIDRRLLAGLERPVWDSVAAGLQARLTDEVIDAAVRRLPPEYYERDGERMARALKARRDGLPEAAAGLYRLIAGEVDVRATNEAEIATVRRGGDGSLELALARRDGDGDRAREPYFRRRFHSGETKEVRLHLLGGGDSVSVEGSGGPRLRVLGGDGADVVNAPSGGAKLYDTDPDSRAIGAGVDRRPYAPPDSTSRVRPAPRDWGHRWQAMPWVQYAPEIGFFFGVSPGIQTYGFRKDPYASSWRLSLGYATSAEAGRAVLDGDVRFTNSPMRFLVHARASGADVVRYFGFGNETPFFEPDDFFRVRQQQYELSLGLGWLLTRGLTFDIGPTGRYATTDLDDPTLVAAERPYGSDDFGQVGGRARLAYDSRDFRGAPTRGVYLAVEGTVFPKVWDVETTYGTVTGAASTYLTAPIPLRPTLALRAGGEYVWGDQFPFFDAAHVGGAASVRGLRERRYIGDRAAWGNAELRLSFGRASIVVPTEVGIFGLADAGRVWREGEDSDEWHEAFGGGVWFAFLSRANAINFSLARSEGRTAFYFRAGFGY
ncbi:MAG TPA: BamA/TamA family outer membrane protein [Gemmatimonadales bacterium]|nr:BamA/TamA family outer membrane protein [Gemmatimonadales bacterium]